MKSAILSLFACCILLPATFAAASPGTSGTHSGYSVLNTVPTPLPVERAATAEEEAIHCRVELTNGVVVECWLCNCANLYASLVPQAPGAITRP
jgi:hypothetical protein